jgi:hypothetical protein
MTTTFTQRLWDRLPGIYRDNDNGDLLAYVSLLGDQADQLETLLRRFEFVPLDQGGAPSDTSDLVDPATADLAWLTWLGQLVGVTLEPQVQGQAARDAVQSASAGFRGGTKNAIADAARSALTGTRYVRVHDHSITTPGDGGEWDILLITRTTETPDVAAVLQAVVTKNGKPAGVVLRHRAYSASWTSVATAYPTWASRAGKTWTQIEETAL